MITTSAGLLMYRRHAGNLEVLLVHPGGPFWARKDQGAWFIPKGELEPGEAPLAAARREFCEETGFDPPAMAGGDAASSLYIPLGEARRSSGKKVMIFAFAGDCDPQQMRSNLFELEWPPRSGNRRQFPEADRAAFFTLAAARASIHAGEWLFLERLAAALNEPPL